MIFNTSEHDRNFFRHLDKRKFLVNIMFLSTLIIWSILIQTSLKPADEKVIYETLEVKPIEFNADLTYINQFIKDSEDAKLNRLYTKFDPVINPDGSRIFLSLENKPLD